MMEQCVIVIVELQIWIALVMNFQLLGALRPLGIFVILHHRVLVDF